MDICNFKGCDRKVWSRGLCGTHYAQFRKGKTLTPIQDQTKGVCKEPDCDLPHHAKGWCYAHYMRDYKGSSYTGPVKQMRTPGKRPCGKTRCPGAYRLQKHLHYLANRDEVIKKAAARDPEERSRHRKKWKSQNLGKVRAHNMARKRGLKHATPDWLTEDQWAEINALYAEAQEKGMHVDHIVPLKGGTVCGLHVPWNLRILDPKENMRRPRVWKVQ